MNLSFCSRSFLVGPDWPREERERERKSGARQAGEGETSFPFASFPGGHLGADSLAEEDQREL